MAKYLPPWKKQNKKQTKSKTGRGQGHLNLALEDLHKLKALVVVAACPFHSGEKQRQTVFRK